MTMQTTRPVHLAPRLDVGPFRTWPNAMTLARTLVAVVLGGYAIATEDVRLTAIAYAAYWVGDMADGWLARRLDQETRAGAVFDIISDRACTVLLCAGLLAHLSEAWLVIVAFLVSFAVLDTMLSLAFLCWPIVSPNYFDQVDELVWRLNWSPAAKAVNTAGVVVAIVAGAYTVALLVVLAVGATKLWSMARVVRLLEGTEPR